MASIAKRNGRWRAEVVRRPRRWSRTFNTLTAARAWALELEDFLDRGGDPNRPDKLTVGEWEAVWWKARVAEKTTLRSNRSRLDVHILPVWKNVPLGNVTPMAVQAWVRGMERDGVGPSTVAAALNLLSGLLSSAVREGHIPANPCRDVKRPRSPQHRETYLTHDETVRLLDCFTGPQRTIALTLVSTGLRWGEMAGLEVPALDLLRRRLEVVKVMTVFGPKLYPKGGGRRTVPLPRVLVDALAAHLVGHDGGLVFTEDGAPLNNMNWRKRHWLPAVKKAGLDVRIHDLRHTYASRLVQAGRPLEEVQQLLGHRSIVTTSRYAHFAPHHGLPAVAVLDSLAWPGGLQADGTYAEGG